MDINLLSMNDEAFKELPFPVPMDGRHFLENYNTQLNPKEEAVYQEWAFTNNREKDTQDYDMRGAWKQGIQQSKDNHFPDTFKKPNHPTFSDQSVYHGTYRPNKEKFIGGNWSKWDSNTVFTPSLEMVSQPGYIKFMQEHYMSKVEPNTVFNIDRRK